MSLSDLQVGAWNVVGLDAQRNGERYFVDVNNGSDYCSGKDWDSPWQTLEKAIAVSNANIAAGKKGWAARNAIYIGGDTFEEDLVAFPNKCDMIGCGSYDANAMAGIKGHHVPVNTGNYGTRFFNIFFKGKAVAAPIFTLASTSSGIQIIDSQVSAAVTGTCSTIGIQATASPFLKVIRTRFEGPFSTSYMTLGVGEAGGTEIIGCRMTDGAASGIVINASTTTSWGAFIDDCRIKAATVCLNDASNLFHVTNTDFISLASVTGYTSPAEAVINNAALCSRCYITAANVNFAWPIADTTT